jgi:3-keto-5-aminohexanoate cleavage enzyme
VDELIIAVGVNEDVTREQNPHVPITPDEIAEDIAECVAAGASVFHLHARDPETGRTRYHDGDLYRQIFAAVRQRTDALCYPTYVPTGIEETYRHVVSLAEFDDAPLEIGPVISGSANIGVADVGQGTFVGGEFVLAQSQASLLYQLEVCRRYDLWVSHDVFEPGGVRSAIAAWRMGHYVRPMLLKLFMSDDRPFGFPPHPRFLQAYVDMLPADLDCEWLFLPYGVNIDDAMACLEWSIANGGHVRVGVGDNPTAPGYSGSNADRVRQMVELAEAHDRPVATVEDVRQRFVGPRE